MNGPWLEYDRLEGTIPPSLGNCKNLLSLNFAQNNLSGTIPKQLVRVSFLSISNDSPLCSNFECTGTTDMLNRYSSKTLCSNFCSNTFKVHPILVEKS